LVKEERESLKNLKGSDLFRVFKTEATEIGKV
jgi:hypothetical protein